MVDRIVPFTDAQLWNSLNAVVPCWILLALAPTSKLTQAACLLVTLYLCLLYSALMLPMVASPGGMEGMQKLFSLEGVIEAFKAPDLVFVAWVHFVAFDLWTGRWIALDAAQRRVPRLLVVPILFFTLMLGPVGLGLYFLLRSLFSAPKSKRD